MKIFSPRSHRKSGETNLRLFSYIFTSNTLPQSWHTNFTFFFPLNPVATPTAPSIGPPAAVPIAPPIKPLAFLKLFFWRHRNYVCTPTKHIWTFYFWHFRFPPQIYTFYYNITFYHKMIDNKTVNKVYRKGKCNKKFAHI